MKYILGLLSFASLALSIILVIEVAWVAFDCGFVSECFSKSEHLQEIILVGVPVWLLNLLVRFAPLVKNPK